MSNETKTKTIYTTIGSVRGCCGHRHKSYEAAEKCLEEDRRGCRSQRGYSDRIVVETDEDGCLCDERGNPYYPYGRGSRAAHVDDIGGRL